MPELGVSGFVQAKALAEEIDRGTTFLTLAHAVGELKKTLNGFPPDLADQLAVAQHDEQAKNEGNLSAANALAAAEARLQQSQQQQDRFAEVEVGVTCSRCGQPVDEKHAAKERKRLAKEIKERDSEVNESRVAANTAKSAFRSAVERRGLLQNNKTKFDRLQAEYNAKGDNLTELGGMTDADELETRLATQRQSKKQAEDQAIAERGKREHADKDVKRLVNEKPSLDAALKAAAERLRSLETQLSNCSIERKLKWEQLTPEWQQRFPGLDSKQVATLAAERQRLVQAGVTSKFDLLCQDATLRDEWIKQLDSVRAEIENIPLDARLTAEEALRGQGDAQTAASDASTKRDTARRARDTLKSRADEYDQLTAQLRSVEREHDLHKKLDDLLGQNGLQRELVRDAEQQIVSLANDTLQNLSDGDLSLEQDDEVTGRDDKAFALRVRRAGDALPTGVLFLSGSQKFRVAVSVALAVGRFASGRARPLEAVIIDEGFGNLDKDGLRAMAEELKRLQRSQALKRVVLVSHQEEFTDQFAVGYQLCAQENGTTATAFRR